MSSQRRPIRSSLTKREMKPPKVRSHRALPPLSRSTRSLLLPTTSPSIHHNRPLQTPARDKPPPASPRPNIYKGCTPAAVRRERARRGRSARVVRPGIGGSHYVSAYTKRTPSILIVCPNVAVSKPSHNMAYSDRPVDYPPQQIYTPS